jgi:hypothetical protein
MVPPLPLSAAKRCRRKGHTPLHYRHYRPVDAAPLFCTRWLAAARRCGGSCGPTRRLLLKRVWRLCSFRMHRCFYDGRLLPSLFRTHGGSYIGLGGCFRSRSRRGTILIGAGRLYYFDAGLGLYFCACLGGYFCAGSSG